MADISFSERLEDSWVVAGWAFRQILDDVISQHSVDAEMVRLLAESKECRLLHVHSLDSEMAARIKAAITHVAKGILSGTVRSGILDQVYSGGNTIEEYRKGLQELLNAIPDAPGTHQS